MAPYYGTRLVRFDIASELSGIPLKPNPRGIDWSAPRYAWITHATFNAHRSKTGRDCAPQLAPERARGPRAPAQGPVRAHGPRGVLPAAGVRP